LVVVTQFFQGLSNRTGQTWAKYYKRQHGTISNFLRSHPDYFTVVEDQVFLVPEGTVVNTEEGSAASTTSAEAAEVTAAAEAAGAAVEAVEQSGGPKWFDFNDSSVNPIEESTIAKQFAGKESAYMLFYARRSVFESCAPVELPQGLQQIVEAANSALATVSQPSSFLHSFSCE
jgi:ubiquitin carboxyl-terminal hydrolase 40